MSDKYKRDVNSLLGFSLPSVDDLDNERDNARGNRDHNENRDHDNRSQNGNQNNNGRHDNRDNNNQKKDGNNRNQNDQNRQNNQNNGSQQWNNPVCKIFRTDRVFDRDDVLDLLTHKDGLVIMIKDLKTARKNPDKAQCANYVQKLLRDIVFASALPEALEDVCGKKYDENDAIGRKELGYLMSEILVFLNSSFNDDRLVKMYDEETVDTMRRSYTDILYRYNKKKVKKLCEEIKNMTKGNAKQICIITAGNNPSSSVYQLLKFLYRGGNGTDEMFSTSVKSLTKLLKICFGKDDMNRVIRCIMLEKVNNNLTGDAEDVSVNLDILIRDYLESLDKNEIYSIIKEYIADRKRQERNGVIARRFGDRRTIHPDDYPKLTKALEDLERKDFSAIPYLRK